MDGPWTDVEPAIWSIVEVCVGILCACLPTYRPLIVSAFHFRQCGHWPASRQKLSNSTDSTNPVIESNNDLSGKEPLKMEIETYAFSKRNDV